MECEKYRDLISLYIDGEINENDEKELLEHLENCPLCRKEFEELKAITDMLGKIEEAELPENFHTEVMTAIKAQSSPIKKNKPKRIWARYASLAASICALFIVGASVLGSGMLGMGSSAADAASEEMYFSQATTNSAMPEAEKYDMVVENSMVSGTADGTAYKSSLEAGVAKQRADLKIIKTASLDIRVKSFDETVEAIRVDVENKGGYVENFNSYVYNERWVNGEQISLHEGNLTLRVPSDDYDAAYEYLKTLGDVTNENENRDNVTESYIDVESRMLVKKTEEQRLVELLAKAENIDDIIQLESRLSVVRGEIESYEAQLKHWDKEVDYSTINVFITEDPDEAVEPVSPDLGTRIKNSFNRGINRFVSGVENFIINIAGNAVSIVIFVAVVVVVIVAGRKGIKKMKNKKKDEE